MPSHPAGPNWGRDIEQHQMALSRWYQIIEEAHRLAGLYPALSQLETREVMGQFGPLSCSTVFRM